MCTAGAEWGMDKHTRGNTSIRSIKVPHVIHPQPQLPTERKLVELHPHARLPSGAEQRVGRTRLHALSVSLCSDELP